MSRSTRRRACVLLLVLLVAALTGAAVTPAVARAAAVPRVSLDPPGGPVGTPVTARGTGFAAGETVDVRWETFVWATGTADTSGTVVIGFDVPGTSAGVHQVWLTGRSSTRTGGAPFAVREDWAQLGGGPGHGSSAFHAPDLDRLALDWSWDLGNDGGRTDGAVVSDGAVYATTAGGNVSSLTTSGTFRWNHDLGHRVAGTPAVAGDRLVVVQRNGVVVGLDVITGATRWSVSLHATSSVAPAAEDGRAYVGLDDGRVVALDATTGALAWTAAGAGAVTTAPTVTAAAIVVARGAQISAVAVRTGTPRWSTDVGGSGVSGAVPWSASTNRLVAVSPGVGLVGLNSGTGAVQWTLPGVRTPFAVTVVGGLVYAERDVAAGVTVAAVGAARGNVLRNQAFTVAPGVSPMTFTGYGSGYLFSFAAGGVLRAIVPSRGPDAVAWSTQLDPATAPIAAADGALFVVTSAGVLQRYVS